MKIIVMERGPYCDQVDENGLPVATDRHAPSCRVFWLDRRTGQLNIEYLPRRWTSPPTAARQRLNQPAGSTTPKRKLQRLGSPLELCRSSDTTLGPARAAAAAEKPPFRPRRRIQAPVRPPTSGFLSSASVISAASHLHARGPVSTGSLRGITYCPEASIPPPAQAFLKPPCFEQIGRTRIRRRPGLAPLHVIGVMYLAGRSRARRCRWWRAPGARKARRRRDPGGPGGDHDHPLDARHGCIRQGPADHRYRTAAPTALDHRHHRPPAFRRRTGR